MEWAVHLICLCIHNAARPLQEHTKPAVTKRKQLISNYPKNTLIMLRNLHHNLGAAMLYHLSLCFSFALSFIFNDMNDWMYECPGATTVHLWWRKMAKTIDVNKKKTFFNLSGSNKSKTNEHLKKEKPLFPQACIWEMIKILKYLRGPFDFLNQFSWLVYLCSHLVHTQQNSATEPYWRYFC